MATAPKRPDDDLPRGMNVESFLKWMDPRRGRFELHDGAVVAMAPERVGHIATKGRVYRVLDQAVRAGDLPCHVMPDGVAVHVSDRKWYQPDALVYCGPLASDQAMKIDNPIIIVEVISPSTGHIDEGAKLIGYFSLPSVQHYLIVNPEGLPLVHHQRQSNDTTPTRIVAGGSLRLDPPGIEIDVTELFN